jgi:hypothetical protein
LPGIGGNMLAEPRESLTVCVLNHLATEGWAGTNGPEHAGNTAQNPIRAGDVYGFWKVWRVVYVELHGEMHAVVSRQQHKGVGGSIGSRSHETLRNANLFGVHFVAGAVLRIGKRDFVAE